MPFYEIILGYTTICNLDISQTSMLTETTISSKHKFWWWFKAVCWELKFTILSRYTKSVPEWSCLKPRRSAPISCETIFQAKLCYLWHVICQSRGTKLSLDYILNYEILYISLSYYEGISGHQSITKINCDLSSMAFFGKHPRPISQEVPNRIYQLVQLVWKV